MYDAIAAHKEMLLYFSLSILFVGLVLGMIISLGGRYYRFTTGGAEVFVHASILRSYVEYYAYQAFPSQSPAIKVCLNRYHEIIVVIDLLKQIDDIQIFEQVERDLSELFSCYLGYRGTLFLEIIY